MYRGLPRTSGEKGLNVLQILEVWEKSMKEDSDLPPRKSNESKKFFVHETTVIDVDVEIGSYVKIQNNVSFYGGVILEGYVFCDPSRVFSNVPVPRRKYLQVGAQFYKRILVKEGPQSELFPLSSAAIRSAGSLLSERAPSSREIFPISPLPSAIRCGFPAG